MSQCAGGSTSVQLSEHLPDLELHGAGGGAGGGGHAVQMPQVASQMPSPMLSRSGHRPSASCSAQVGSLQCFGGSTSTQWSEHLVAHGGGGGGGGGAQRKQILHVCSQ